jgi:hypothetical protein
MSGTHGAAMILALLLAPPALGGSLLLSDEQLDAVTAGALVTTIGGEAVAVGQDTVAAGNVDLSLVDMKNRTVAKGRVTMAAAASSAEGSSPPYVAAETFAYAEGADVVLIKMNTVTNSDQSMSISITKINAIDLKNVDLRAPVVVTHTMAKTRKGTAVVPSGNVATLDFSASAIAKDTLVDVQADILAVQNELSTATINVIAAGG